MSSERSFGSKSNGVSDQDVGGEGIGGGDRTRDVEEFNSYFYPPLPPHSFSHPNQYWVSDSMNPGGPVGNQPQPTQGPSMPINDGDWWYDAPMPPDEDYRYPSSNGSASAKNESTHPRVPFTEQRDENIMTSSPPRSARPNHGNAPPTPSSNIPQMERMNLNQTPGPQLRPISLQPVREEPISQPPPVNFSVRSDLEAPKPKQSIEPELMLVYPRLNDHVVPEQLDPNEMRSWCSVTYNNLNNKIDSTYTPNAALSRFSIENTQFEGPDKMNLSTYTPPTVPKGAECLKQVQLGIHIICEDDSVYIKLLTPATVFVLSAFVNFAEKKKKETVCRLKNDTKDDENNQQVVIGKYKKFRIYNRLASEAEINRVFHEEGLERCYEVAQSFSTIRISFVKGFGEDYGKTVSDCPIWFDLFLNGPMELFDRIQRNSNVAYDIGSRS